MTAPIEVASGVWRLNLPIGSHFLRSVNVYLLRDGDGCVLIDCGQDIDECWLSLTRQLPLLGVPLSAIHTVILTHGHRDHYGLATRVRELSGARLWLHEEDVAFMQHRWLREDSNAILLAWLLRYGFPEEESREVARKMGAVRQEVVALEPDRILRGGEDVSVGGFHFGVQWTPGHTPGHICLYEHQRHLLLCGDHVLRQVAPNVSLQPYADSNPMPGYLASLEQIVRLPATLSLPGHGDPFEDVQARAKELLDHQLGRRARLVALLTEKPVTAYDLAGQVWADSRPTSWAAFSGPLRRNAVATLAAHLEMLADEGLVGRHEDGQVRFSASASRA